MLPGLLCLSLIGPAGAEPLPAFTADYYVLRNGITIGKSKVTLKIPGRGQFQYESVTRAAGVLEWLFQKDRIREYSQGIFHNNGVRPLTYRYENTGKGEKRTEQLIFDWNAAKVRQTTREPTWKIDLPESTLDKAAMKLALMLDLQRKREDVTYAIADDAKLRHYRFRVVGRETVTVPAGEIETIKLERTRDKKRRSTFIWSAPSLGFLPVLMEQRKEEGTVYRTELRRYSATLRTSATNTRADSVDAKPRLVTSPD